MPIWKKPIDLALLKAANRNTAVEHLGIEFVEVGDDFLRARVPVDHRTIQPFGLLHGGVSVVLAESMGSTGAYYALPEGYRAVGLDINANHLRSATSGWVTGTAKPVHIGRTTHVWHIDLHNEAGLPPERLRRFPLLSNHWRDSGRGTMPSLRGGRCSASLVWGAPVSNGWWKFE
eukprot:gene14656-31176_t